MLEIRVLEPEDSTVVKALAGHSNPDSIPGTSCDPLNLSEMILVAPGVRNESCMEKGKSARG